MKYVRFQNGDWSIELAPDSDTESADVRFDVQGTNDESEVTNVTAYLPADEARQLAAYIIEMADAAEAQQKAAREEVLAQKARKAGAP